MPRHIVYHNVPRALGDILRQYRDCAALNDGKLSEGICARRLLPLLLLLQGMSRQCRVNDRRVVVRLYFFQKNIISSTDIQ
jgi:hypothetical protein